VINEIAPFSKISLAFVLGALVNFEISLGYWVIEFVHQETSSIRYMFCVIVIREIIVLTIDDLYKRIFWYKFLNFRVIDLGSIVINFLRRNRITLF
jgi:hypothetical protein